MSVEIQVESDQMHFRIAAIERSVCELRQEVALLRQARTPGMPAASDADPRLSDVVAITEEMFGTPEVGILCDPEDPEVTFVVFTVKCTGQSTELVEKRIEWHEKVDSIPPGSSGRFRLSILPQ